MRRKQSTKRERSTAVAVHFTPPTLFLSDAVQDLLASDPAAVPGTTHCAWCARALAGLKAVRCQGCDRVAYCRTSCKAEDQRVGTHGACCEALAAIAACDAVADDASGDGDALEAAWDEACRDQVWMWDERFVAADGAELARVWRVTEALSAPLALRDALRRPECSSVLRRDDGVTIIHVLGVERELCVPVWERLVCNVLGVRSAQLVAVGPLVEEHVDWSSPSVRVRVVRECYSAGVAASLGAPPTLVVAFNPGFTVSDYDWRDALRAVRTLLVTTCHSAEEAEAERQVLDEAAFDCIAQWANPYASLRCYQSGTCANEFYRKNMRISLWRPRQ